jgi:hypothetical protein
MSARIVGVRTETVRSPLAVSLMLDQERPDYVVFGRQIDTDTMSLVERAIGETRQPDVVVVFDPNDASRSPSMRETLPPLISLIAASPLDDPAVALAVKAVRFTSAAVQHAASAGELILRVAEGREISFAELTASSEPLVRRRPSLAMPSSGASDLWLREFIERVPFPGAKVNNPDVIALRAGLYLLNDFFEESHSCSQSIEGHQAGDYWHAILHRREPDYGNAKYWFRHVGRHPIFGELQSQVGAKLSQAVGPLAVKLESWKSRLMTSSGWEPFTFVDLCSAAATDSDLRVWCEEVQFYEMLLLLTATSRDVTT